MKNSFLLSFLLVSAVFFKTESVFGQEGEDLSPPMEVGLLVGRLLPNQIDGIDEVMSLSGLHFAYRLSPMVYAQSFVHAGKGEGQSWKSLGLSVRMDQTLEEFLVSFYGGAQSTLSSGPSSSEKNVWGAFLGGSLLAGTGGPTWLKLDMNFGFGPGTSLFISLGLLFRF